MPDARPTRAELAALLVRLIEARDAPGTMEGYAEEAIEIAEEARTILGAGHARANAERPEAG